ncbi:MAG: hypothetical protein RLZZ117_578 [Cyanobacteriota bacterium]
MLVMFHFHALGYSTLEIAILFLFYEFFGIVTNLHGGWLVSRLSPHLDAARRDRPHEAKYWLHGPLLPLPGDQSARTGAFFSSARAMSGSWWLCRCFLQAALE